MLKKFCIRQSKNLRDPHGFMICLRKHHQSRVIAESIDSMNISHFELLSDLFIAFWERSRSMHRNLPGKPDEFPRYDYQPMLLRLGPDSPHHLISTKGGRSHKIEKNQSMRA